MLVVYTFSGYCCGLGSKDHLQQGVTPGLVKEGMLYKMFRPLPGYGWSAGDVIQNQETPQAHSILVVHSEG